MIKVNFGLQGPIAALGNLLWVLMGPQFQYLTQYSDGQKFSMYIKGAYSRKPKWKKEFILQLHPINS